MKRSLIAKRVKKGERLPRFYGISYFDEYQSAVIAHPLPFNFVVAAVRQVSLFLLWGLRPSKAQLVIEKAEKRAFEAGYKMGMVAGAQTAKKAYVKAMGHRRGKPGMVRRH